MSIKIGIVCEGITDYRVLKHLTESYLRGYDAYVIPLKPKVTPQGSQDGFGSWTGVLEYITGNDGMIFEAINEGCDYVIIHIDTDVCDQYGVSRVSKNPQVLHADVLKRLLAQVHPQFNRRKLIFAIAIDETECWLIPFLSNDSARCSRTHLCISAVNNLYNGEGSIDPKNKNAEAARTVYTNILRKKKKAKEIKAISTYNFGFEYFINSLDRIKANLHTH